MIKGITTPASTDKHASFLLQQLDQHCLEELA
jgi:hypothetical protein